MKYWRVVGFKLFLIIVHSALRVVLSCCRLQFDFKSSKTKNFKTGIQFTALRLDVQHSKFFRICPSLAIDSWQQGNSLRSCTVLTWWNFIVQLLRLSWNLIGKLRNNSEIFFLVQLSENWFKLLLHVDTTTPVTVTQSFFNAKRISRYQSFHYKFHLLQC